MLALFGWQVMAPSDDVISIDASLANATADGDYVIRGLVDLARRKLAAFAESETNRVEAHKLFGDSELLTVFLDQMIRGQFSIPEIRVVDTSVLPTADGAYLPAIDLILFSDRLLHEGMEGRLEDVLLEEIGHAISQRVSEDEVPGDEGFLFAAMVRGEPLGGPIGDGRGAVTLDGIVYAAEFATVSDSGGFEGSQQTLKLETKGGGTLTYSYEHFTIPDRFIIRYEGKTLLDTGFVGGGRSGTIQIPQGTSDEIDIRVATDDAGTAWSYTVTAEECDDISPLTIAAAGGSFTHNPTTDKCETTGTVSVGRKDGRASLFHAINTTTEYDKSAIDIKNGTIFSDIGGVTQSLFQANLSISPQTRSSAISETGTGEFKLAGLDVDFKSITLLQNELGFDISFVLPDQASGLLVPTVSAGKNAFIIDSTGPHFAYGGKISLPNAPTFKLLNVVDVEAKNLSLEYRAGEDALRLQGKISFDSFAKTVGGISKVEADLSGNNYVQINHDARVDLVGSLKVGRDLAMPKGWGLSEIELTINTVTHEIGGSATVRTPFGVSFGEGLAVKPSLEFFTNPFSLDAVGVELDNINKPIPSYPVFFFQGVRGKINNFAENNPADIEFSGGISATLGPQRGGSRLARLDLDGKITPKMIEGTSNLELLTIEFDAFGNKVGPLSIAKSTGTTTLDWSAGLMKQVGSFNLLDGLVVTNTTVAFDTEFNFGTGGAATVGIPNYVPLFGGAQLANANYAIKFTNDGNYSNDFVAGWGQITIQKLGFEIDVTAGIRANFDGTMVRIGAGNLPVVGSWDIPASKEYVLFAAEWDNADPSVQLLVTLPNGTIITEDQFAANNIAIVDELSSDTQRTIVAINPVEGRWHVDVDDSTGLGTVRTEALTETPGPTFRFLTPGLVKLSDGDVRIDFESFDPDSAANISFWYDDDDSVADGVFIGSTTEADGAGSFVWDTTSVAAGDYFVYALVDDNANPILTQFSSEKVTAGSSVDLAATITAGVASITRGDQITYTVKVENLASVAAAGVVALVNLPAAAAFVSASITPSTVSDGELTFALGDLAAAGVTSIEIVVDTDGVPTDPTTLTADVVVIADTYDPEPANDGNSVGVLSTPPAPSLADLVVTTLDPPDALALNEPFSFEVQITNQGGAPATGVIFSEFIPNAGNLRLNGSGTLSATDTYQLGLGTIAPGQTVTVTVSGLAQAAGPLLSSSSVQANGESNSTDNESVRELNVQSLGLESADLSLTANATLPDDNDVSTLTISLNNSGPGIASAIKVAVDTPDGVQVTGISTVQGSFDPATGIWDLGNVRDFLSRDLVLTLDSSAALQGAHHVTAELIAVDEPDPDSTPNNHVKTEDDIVVVDLGFSTLPDQLYTESGRIGVLGQTSDGQLDFLEFKGNTLSQSHLGGAYWPVKADVDYDGDGRIDLITQDASGQIDLLFSNDQGAIERSLLLDGQYWNVVGAGDFDGSGRIAIATQSDAGEIDLLYFTGTQLTESALLRGRYWDVVGTADLNGDRKADFVTQDTKEDGGQLDLLFFNNFDLVGSALTPDSYWTVRDVSETTQVGRFLATTQDPVSGAIDHLQFEGTTLTASLLEEPGSHEGLKVVASWGVSNEFWNI
ncbi:hypothetical protein FDV58_40810 [Bradyrhizobium elkanii]|uniref:DUF11 domain-containing protein n=2 Tax=Nitrobacteraceae TaxID=41294 RepID=A0A4U6RAW7_BRAEL|nr:hypothetical protein [Bradyrhizobium sp. BR2003]TKV70930.1 hypothetical protein FDV58_40810 [Bradyrhizobium elkanii]